MWNRFFKLVSQVFNYHQDLRTLKETTKQQALQIRELADNQKRMEYEAQLQRERDARERERILHQLQLAIRDRTESDLRLEIQQLREQVARLSLPPSTSKPPDEPTKG